MRRGVIILLAGLFVFAPGFHGGWLIDDNYEVTNNAAIQNPAGLPIIWKGEANPDYLPLKSTVQWVLWHCFGSNPLPFRLTSLALHLLSALLVWRLLWRLGLRHAWLGGLLFAVHPLLVESVAWPAELKNTLSLSLLLPAMLAWLRFDERRRWRDYAWALGGFVAALLCKSSVIMLPAVLLLHAWWKRGRVGRGDVVASLPFWGVSLAAGVATVLLQTQRAIGTEVFPVGGPASRLGLTGTNLAFYLEKTLWPFHLLPMYPQWRVDPPSALEFLPWPLLGALLVWCWTRRATWGRAVLLGLGFFLLNIVPVLGFFKMSYWRIAWASDHLAYLPSLGMIGLAATGAGAVCDRLSGRWRAGALGAGWLAVAGLIFAAHRDADVYRSVDTLCEYTLAANPDAWLAHQLLAVSDQDKHDFRAALAHAEAACRLKPDIAETQNTLGGALDALGRQQEAIPHLREAIRLAPAVWGIHINLAHCLVGTGQYEEGAREYRFLLARAPDNPVFLCNSGICLYRLGQVDESIARFRRALEINPNLQDARTSLDVALKRRSGAEERF